MKPEVRDRLVAIENAPGPADLRMMAKFAVVFENFFDEMGCPLSDEQSAALKPLLAGVGAA